MLSAPLLRRAERIVCKTCVPVARSLKASIRDTGHSVSIAIRGSNEHEHDDVRPGAPFAAIRLKITEPQQPTLR
jgi:hypothetical protein